YKYYINFPKVYANVDAVRIELNILNSLIGSRTIESDFEKIITRYPETLKCIPILLAKRGKDIVAMDQEGQFCYNFAKKNYPVSQYKVFMRKTGLFDLMENHLINNLVDYVTGVETGLDSNGRKNRGGHLMEDLVERYLIKAGLVKDDTYFKEMYIHEIEKKWHVDLSAISNNGSAEKRFDYVIKSPRIIYGIETNFYSSSGSKLNETARSYKTITLETQSLDFFKFVWFTDGQGWLRARNNLKETFDVLDNLYNIKDLEEGVISKLMEG
ncbi:MAG: type II restriction endonuclease, partial [Bacteroidia bacterium]|nr:type II restriction endonuclease [Bacteroidia bacterium]